MQRITAYLGIKIEKRWNKKSNIWNRKIDINTIFLRKQNKDFIEIVLL